MELEETSFDFACGDSIPSLPYGILDSQKTCSNKVYNLMYQFDMNLQCFIGDLHPYGSRGCQLLQQTLNKRSCCRGSKRQCTLECRSDMKRCKILFTLLFYDQFLSCLLYIKNARVWTVCFRLERRSEQISETR